MKMVKVSIILMIAIMAVASVAFAAPVRIGSLEQNIADPVRVALDAQGNIYVTEARRDIVLVFDGKGQFKTSLPVSRPLGVAVAPNGSVYVTSANQRTKNAVYVFAADYTKAGCLGGAACAEFVKPVDVTVDAGGNIYVVDNDPDISSVTVYDGSGALVRTILGSGATRLRKPMGVAVDAGTGLVYVSDLPKVSTTNGDIDGARIQAFDAAGNVVLTLGQFGGNVGQINAPVAVALDGKGNLYVTDSFQNVTHILSVADGSYVGNLADATIAGFNPNGVAISKNGLVYVVLQKGVGNTGRVDIYALDGYVTMAAAPSALLFEGRQYAGNPAPQTLSITNSGSGTLNWTAGASDAWILLGQASGAAGAAGKSDITVGVDITAMAPGIRTGTITVKSDYGQTETVGVTVNVLKPLVLNISNGWLTFTAKKGKAAAAQTVAIGVDNLTASQSWSAVSDSTWLTVSPAAGTLTTAAAKATATVSVNTTGMAAGVYKGAIKVSAPGVVGDGGVIAVTLTVQPVSKLSVNTNSADAKFQVSGPAKFSGTGRAWSVEDVPAGEYTVSFEAVNGYQKPKDQKKSLVTDGEVFFSGAYVSWTDLASRKNILAAGTLGKRFAGDLVSVYKNTGALAESFNAPSGSDGLGASIAVADVDGDGNDEIIVAAGAYRDSPATVVVLKADKTQLLSFVPFANASSIRVAAGDLDGNGASEIVVVPVNARGGAGNARIYAFDSALRTMVEAASEVQLFTKALTADIAVADMDGDGKAELLSASGSEDSGSASVQVWKIDATKGMGNWAVSLVRDEPLAGKVSSIAVAAGDVDGDGAAEIIVGATSSGNGGQLTIVKADGAKSKIELFGKEAVRGMSLAAADLDGDGKADIVVAPAMESGKSSRKKDGVIEVLSGAGKHLFTLPGTKEGMNVAVGDLAL